MTKLWKARHQNKPNIASLFLIFINFKKNENNFKFLCKKFDSRILGSRIIASSRSETLNQTQQKLKGTPPLFFLYVERRR